LNFIPAPAGNTLCGLNAALPTVTILIAARPDQAEIKAVSAGRLLDYPREKLEMIVARGKQPSVQRNDAMKAATGDLIYFLDDDSAPPPGNLQRAVKHFADPSVKMVGGPNLCPPDAPFIEQVFALVHSSWLAFASSRARYCPVGKIRESGEKELILCNLIARRPDMLDCGGFNEALYPNEENALMDDLQKKGGKLIYDPEMIVHRRPRNSLRAFQKMLLNYGRGRAEQFRLNPTAGSAANFVPPVFCLYLLALPLLLFVPWPIGKFLLVPLCFYAVAVLLQALALMPMGGFFRSACAMPLIVMTHLLYGAGFWRGLIAPIKSSATKVRPSVVLEKIQF
jgi:hypothetical protein